MTITDRFQRHPMHTVEVNYKLVQKTNPLVCLYKLGQYFLSCDAPLHHRLYHTPYLIEPDSGQLNNNHGYKLFIFLYASKLVTTVELYIPYLQNTLIGWNSTAYKNTTS